MKQIVTTILRHLPIPGLLLALLLVGGYPPDSSLAQSFPTFTPTPGPATNTPVPQPTNTPPAQQPTNTPPAQQPTNTPPAQQPTNTPAAATTTPISTSPAGTVSATPVVSEPIPTAEPCSPTPTLLTITAITVRQGPGTAYPLWGQLAADEVVLLAGRAAAATWWAIEVDNGVTGWVANSRTAVSIQGDIDRLPIIEAPAINGSTPTPGPTWQPTANPHCTITPTATRPATTPTATATATGEAESDVIATPETAAAGSEQDLAENEVATPAPLATDPANGSSNWLPIVGITLILMGIAAAFLLRR
jgi:uncharacterized protein YraI